MSADVSWAAELRASPALFPFALDPATDSVRLVPLTRADYAAASFLDDRMKLPPGAGQWRPWAEVRDAAAGLAPRCHFVFHISHVGSTLLARLFDLRPELLALREPLILRGLAEVRPLLADPQHRAAFDARLAVLLGLWSRTFEPAQTAVVKATSVVSELAEVLLGLVPAARAVLMFVPPATFLRALLGGAMSDIEGHAGARLGRLHRRLGAAHWRLPDLSTGERVAMSWLCESLALAAAAARFPDRVLWVDFDRFLADPAAGLRASLAHVGVAADAAFVRAAVTGPTMAEYSKAPGHAYDGRVRQQLLAEADRKHGPEVARGLAWLRDAARLPPVRDLFERLASVS